MLSRLLEAISQRNWQEASSVFGRIMQDKVNARLSAETRTIFEQAAMPASEVQRVFDEIGDIAETEILCGVRDLKVSTNGEVIGFRSL